MIQAPTITATVLFVAALALVIRNASSWIEGSVFIGGELSFEVVSLIVNLMILWYATQRMRSKPARLAYARVEPDDAWWTKVWTDAAAGVGLLAVNAVFG